MSYGGGESLFILKKVCDFLRIFTWLSFVHSWSKAWSWIILDSLFRQMWTHFICCHFTVFCRPHVIWPQVSSATVFCVLYLIIMFLIYFPGQKYLKIKLDVFLSSKFHWIRKSILFHLWFQHDVPPKKHKWRQALHSFFHNFSEENTQLCLSYYMNIVFIILIQEFISVIY